MAVWRIYYADGSMVQGRSRADWLAAAGEGVQVIVSTPPSRSLRWHHSGGPVRDRDLWTGDDVYDPFGWGEKRGTLIADPHYRAIWERACADGIS